MDISGRTGTLAAESLKSRHTELAGHFTALAEKRDRKPVWLIEHNLDETVLRKTVRDLSLMLEYEPDLSAAFWLDHYLPLLVSITEVGYRYGGTGTDFWPVVAADLAVNADHPFRYGVVRLFEHAQHRFALARPGDTAWEQHFPLIAWPVGNALVPAELHARLAETLRRAVRSGLSAGDPQALLDQLSHLAIGYSSRRFENWLRQKATATEVIQRLLLPDSDGWLSDTILRRLDADIRKDPVAQHALTEARRSVARRTARFPDMPASRFCLRLSDGSPVEAFIRGPAVPLHLRNEIISALQIPNDRLRVRGAASTVSLQAFLAGGEISLPALHDIPANPLRCDDMTSSAEDEDTVLTKLQPQEASFFLVNAADKVAVSIFPGETLPANGVVTEVLPADASGQSRFRNLYASLETDASYLRRHSFRIVTSGPDARVRGLPMPGTSPSFATTFPVFAAADVSIIAGKAEAVPAHSGNAAEQGAAGVYLSSGTHTAIRSGSGDGRDQAYVFEMVEPAQVSPAAIAVFPEKATIEDLRSGNLQISIQAPVPLEGVHIRVSLTTDDEPEIHAETVVDRLPKTLSGHSPVFDLLRAGLTGKSARLSRGQLVIEAGGFLPVRMPLPPLTRELRYDPSGLCWTSADDETDPWPSLSASPASPLLSEAETHEELHLVLPLASDMTALPAGIVRAQAPVRPGAGNAGDIYLPAFLREEDDRPDAPGLTRLVRSALAWQMAASDNVLTDWRRQKVADRLEYAAVGLLCGKSWQALDETIDRTALTQHGAFLRRAEQLGLVSGDDLPEVGRNTDRAFLRQRLLDRLTAAVPDFGHSLENWSDDLAGNLDLAVIGAYEDLQAHQRASGRETFDDADMSRRPDLWHQALEEAREIPFLSVFRHLILPANRWEALRRPFYEQLTEDDLVDLLDETHLDASRRSGLRRIGRPELRALLQLWLSPRRMIEADDWPVMLGKSLSDPHTARAVRYVTLRYRLARHDMPDRSVF